MSLLDTFRAMTPADVMEAIAEDPSVLHAWQAEIGKLDRRRLDAVEQFAQAEVAGAHFKAEAARQPDMPPIDGIDLQFRIGAALDTAHLYGGIDGAHHKTWVIDQMVRALTGDRYQQWVAAQQAGADGPNTYEWEEGIAP